MGPARILFVRSTVSDVAVHNNQRRPVLGIQKSSECAGQHIEIVCVANPGNVPPVADKTCGYVFAKGQRSLAFDRIP